MAKNKKIMIATGGTGGHIFPAISVAETFKKNGYSVLITVDERGEKYLEKSDLKYKVIKSGYSLFRLKSLMSIMFGFFQSIFTILRFKPDVVTGFGSYTTLPVLMANGIMHKPLFLHEGNAFVGKINKLFLKKSVNMFTSFQEIFNVNIKDSNTLYFAGAVIRNDLKKYTNQEYKYNGNNLTILITGGSGGASFLSNEFIKVFDFINKDLKSKINVIHQVKTKEELEEVKAFYKKYIIDSEVKTWFDDMPKKMFESDLIVCRSGIGTISEVSALGRPCIMIPSPNVANDHQLYNAKFYSRNNACILLEEKDFVAKDFALKLTNLLNDEGKMTELASNIKSMAILNSNETIFDVINKYIHDNN